MCGAAQVHKINKSAINSIKPVVIALLSDLTQEQINELNDLIRDGKKCDVLDNAPVNKFPGIEQLQDYVKELQLVGNFQIIDISDKDSATKIENLKEGVILR